jgi:hypothetical protein
MKPILALATLALVTLVLEEKGRQVAGEAQSAYGEPWSRHVVQPIPARKRRATATCGPGDSRCGWVRPGTLNPAPVKTPAPNSTDGPPLRRWATGRAL